MPLIYIYIYQLINKASPIFKCVLPFSIAESARAVEYIDFSAKGYDSTNACPRYDTKQYDGKVTVMLEH